MLTIDLVLVFKYEATTRRLSAELSMKHGETTDIHRCDIYSCACTHTSTNEYIAIKKPNIISLK